MIIENKEQIYSRLKISLERERIFIESNQRERILDIILNRMDYIDIYYICSNKASNSIKFFGTNAVIVWDMKYWQCFKAYLIQVENCKQLNENIVQGIICEISAFLSEKYKNIYNISSFLEQIKSKFGVALQLSQEHYKKIYNIIFISKLFSFFHEIGHLEHYKKNSIEIKNYQTLVLTLFNAIKNNEFTFLGVWADLGRQTISHITTRKEEVDKDILEELVSDIYSMVHTVKLYKKLININEFQVICDCMVAEEYISTFQNMFSAVNKAWDAHYVEMKFRTTIRKQNANQYINKLAIVRNGIGSLILVFIVQQVFQLDEEQCNLLLEYTDKNHVDNTDVIACLADDEFICTMIEEAFQV